MERNIRIGKEIIQTDLNQIEFRGKKVEPVGCGGMAVRISTAPLVGKIAENNGIGTIGLTGIGGRIITPEAEYLKENLRVGREELQQAKKQAKGKGIVAGNILAEAHGVDEFCLNDEIMHTADMMFMGAGIKRELFKEIQTRFGKDKDVAVMIPIVSTFRTLALNLKILQTKAKYSPPNDDKYTFYVEQIKAAGHIGLLSPKDLEDPEKEKEYLLEALAEQLATAPFRSEIRVLLGGGIMDYHDVQKAQGYGFDGTLTGTAFANTDESGASNLHKLLISEAHEDSVKTILSPAGYWANFLDTDFVKEGIKQGKLVEIEKYLKEHAEAERIMKEVAKMRDCMTHCLERCGKQGTTRDKLAGNYCIMNHLIQAIEGKKQGIYFASKDAYRVGPTTSAEQRMRKLLQKPE